jgi:hypothetical protein
MITAILLLALMQPQDPGLATNATVSDTTTPAVRTEKLTPAEVKALADANQAVADAQDKLIHAKAALQGTTEGIEQAHHANTDCGCYLESTGRDYDKVEFKGDTIIIHHIHEAPGSLSNSKTSSTQ